MSAEKRPEPGEEEIQAWVERQLAQAPERDEEWHERVLEIYTGSPDQGIAA